MTFDGKQGKALLRIRSFRDPNSLTFVILPKAWQSANNRFPTLYSFMDKRPPFESDLSPSIRAYDFLSTTYYTNEILLAIVSPLTS